MRKFFLSLAAATVCLTAATLMSSNANAAVSTPSAIAPAVVDTGAIQNVRWVRHCHHHHYSSRRHCAWHLHGHRHHHHHHRHHYHHRHGR